MTDLYHTYGRYDYIFDIYDDTILVKNSEEMRITSVNPMELFSVELAPTLHKDMTTFWPSNKNKVYLEISLHAGLLSVIRRPKTPSSAHTNYVQI